MYSYDQFSNLVSAKESGFETIFRSTDIVGNLYETKDCSDRIYGAGSRLEKSCINLKEKRNKYQGGYGKLITKGRQFFYDEEGKKVWERNLDIYGRVKTEEALGEKNFIPFRFQGQYEDEETELYYNRFRYYDSQQGQYTQQDPIGLAGGNPTLYGYVYDTLCELDPFGLGRMPSWMTTRKGWQRHHLIPVSVWDKYFIPQEAGMNVNGATNMTYLPVAQGIDLVNPNSSLHVGWNNVHSEYNQYISQELDKISRLAKENNWGKRKIQKEIRMLQSEVKKNLKKGVIKCH